MKQRILSWLLVLSMALSMIPATVLPVRAAEPKGTDTGGVTLGAITQSYDVSAQSADIEITAGGTYELTGSSTERSVIVKTTDPVTLVLNNLTMERDKSPIQLQDGANVTLVLKAGTTNSITCNATEVTVTHEEPKPDWTPDLDAGETEENRPQITVPGNDGMTAGINVPENATLTIDKVKDETAGALTVQGGYGGAGIGGGAATPGYTEVRGETGAPGGNGVRGSSNKSQVGYGGVGGEGGCFGKDAEKAGTVAIHAGTLTITGGLYGAGIGGGRGADGQNATDKGRDGTPAQNGQSEGGIINAPGGNGGGSGGNGGNGGNGGKGGSLTALTVTGGTLTVTGGTHAAGIGGGSGGDGGAGGEGGNGGAGGNGGYRTNTGKWGGHGGAGAHGATGFKGASPGGDGGVIEISGGHITITGYVAVGAGRTLWPSRLNYNLNHNAGWGGGGLGSYGGANGGYNNANKRPEPTPGNGSLTIQNANVKLNNTVPEDELKLEIPNQPENPGNGGNRDLTMPNNYVRPMNGQPQSEDIYHLVLTVKRLDKTTICKDADINLVLYRDDAAKEYTYTTTTDASGVAHLWLPVMGKNSDTGDVKADFKLYAEGNEIAHRAIGRILKDKAFGIEVKAQDDNTLEAYIGVDYEASSTPDSSKVYRSVDSTTYELKADDVKGAVQLVIDGRTVPDDMNITKLRWFRESIAGNDGQEYDFYAHGNKKKYQDGFAAAAEANPKNAGSSAPTSEEVTTKADLQTIDMTPEQAGENGKKSRLWSLPMKENGRYWVELTYRYQNEEPQQIVKGVVINNLYTAYPLWVRGFWALGESAHEPLSWLYGDGGTGANWQTSKEAKYVRLLGANKQAQTQPYGIPWDLDGYSAKAMKDSDVPAELVQKILDKDHILQTNEVTGVQGGYDEVYVYATDVLKTLYNAQVGNFSKDPDSRYVAIALNTGAADKPLKLTLNRDYFSNATTRYGEIDASGRQLYNKYLVQYLARDGSLNIVLMSGVDEAGEPLYDDVKMFTPQIKDADIRAWDRPGSVLTKVEYAGVDGNWIDITTRNDEFTGGDQMEIQTDLEGLKAYFSKIEDVKKVRFTYKKSTTDVTVKAFYQTVAGETEQMIEGFIPYTVEATYGKEYEPKQPLSIEGYTCVGSNLNQDGKLMVVDPSTLPEEQRKDANVLKYYFTKNEGNVTYRAVVKGATEADDVIVWTKDILVKSGEAPKTEINDGDTQVPPTLKNFVKKDGVAPTITRKDNGAEATVYDGVHDLYVTYEYEKKTKDVTIKAVDLLNNKEIALEAAAATLSKTTGENHTFTAPDLSAKGYKAVGQTTQSYFVDADTAAPTVTFYYMPTDKAPITVTLVYTDAEGQEQTIQVLHNEVEWNSTTTMQAPNLKGYTIVENQPGVNKTEEAGEVKYTLTIIPTRDPDGTNVKGTTAKIQYTKNAPTTVKVVLKELGVADSDLSELLNGWTGTIEVEEGKSATATAPSILNYKLAAGVDVVQTLEWAAIKAAVDANQTPTITFTYEKAEADLITITVEGKLGTQLLYSYTKDVKKSAKNVEIQVFTLAGYKLDNVKMGQTDVSAVDGTYTINPAGTAQTVTATYSSNMADVTINAYYEGTMDTVEGFTPFTVKAEIGKPYSYGALALPGYDNADQATPSLTKVTGTNDHIDYHFTKRTGNVIYKLVAANDENKVLATISETVNKGDTIVKSLDKAPTATNWKLADGQTEGKVDGAVNGKFDGVQAVTVTYKAVAKTKDVTIVRYDVDTNQPIPLTPEEQNAGKTLTATLETGTMHTLQKVNYRPADYTISGKDAVEVYVEDDAEARTVNMYFRRSTDEDVTVNLVYMDEQNQKQTIQTYLVQRKPGTTIKVKAPDMAYKGYTAKQKSVDVQPTQKSVEIEYTVTYYDITIELLDENGRPLNTPAGYETNRKVRKGEGIVLTAPSIADYTLTSKLVVSKTAKELEKDANRTITFKYKNTAASNYVTHTIKLMDADKTPATLITQYNSVVTKGNGTTIYLAPLQDGYQVDNKSQEISNAASQDVVFNYTKSAATVTIKFVDETGTPLTNPQEQILTGYEKGQTIMVPAPIVPGYALAGQWKNNALATMTGVTATLTLNKTDENNEITFAYETRANVTFVLKDDKGNDIQVINGKVGEKYSVADGEKLNLTASGWRFDASNKDNSTEFNNDSASVTVTADAGDKQYNLHYTRIIRDVKYKYVDVTDGKEAEIKFTDPAENPKTANVGENLVVAAPQIPGYTPNALRQTTFVMNGTGAVEVKFEYVKKASGSITINHVVNVNGSETTFASYTTSGPVGEWFTASALETNNDGITTDGRYKLTGDKTQVIQITADAQTLTFVYEANYVTVKTYTSVAGTKTEYQTGIEVVKTEGNQKLYAPSKTGYVLKGIEVTKGSTTDGSPKSFPATGWQDNTLTLTGLTENVEVVYYYEKINDNIKEYQATVTVKDQYASYTLGDWTEIVTKDVESTITPKSHDGYILSGYQIGDSADQKQTITKDQAANFVLTHTFTADTNVTFFYDRADGSAVVPGKDDKFGNEDDVIIKPNGDQLPKVNDDKTVSVPKGGEVVTPNGTVIPPDGSIVKPDGTIVAPGANGKTDPGVTIDPSNPDSAKATYFYVKYLANGGKGEVPTQFFKKGTGITLATNNLTAENKTANGWNAQENGQGTDYANGATLTPTESMTLYAKWTASNYTHKVTITFNANTGVNSATKTQVIGSYTSTAFGGKLDANTFTLDGWTFRGWNTERNGSGTAYTNEQEVTFTSASGDALTLYAQWYRFNKDSSITVPGSDSTPNTDKDVTIHPNGNDNPYIDDKGNVKVPNGAEVTTPNGTIIPPNGSIVKPDGTIVAPDDNGSTEPGVEIDPSKPGDTTNKFITVTYKYGRTDKQVADVVQYGKTTITVMTGSPFTAPTGYQFDGWKVEGSNDKFTGTEVDASTTLVAQWKLAGSVTLAPDKTTESGKRLEPGAKDGELKLVMRGDWAQDKTLTLGALVDGKQATNEVYWRVDADSYKNEFGFTNSVLSGDQIVSVDANTGKLTVLNSGIVRIWCIYKVNPDIKFSVVVVVPGDVNKDGRVNLNDVDMLCDLSDSLNSITAENPDDMTTWYLKELADMDRNGKFGTNDVDALCDLADRLNKI